MIFDPILDIFRGKAVTIPPMDGAFRPDTRLDAAALFAKLGEADNLVSYGGKLLASSGNALLEIATDGTTTPVETFSSAVTALAVSPSGQRALALDTGVLLVDGVTVALPEGLRCITALAYAADGALYLANGAAGLAPSAWVADLMNKGASGSVWKREPGEGGFRQIAKGLAFPYGLLVDGNSVAVSESWRHRLLRLDASGNRSTVLDHLPGYPARLSPGQGGGAWLAIFAPRNRLVEFVLQEKHYRADMLAEVPREFWIAPALSSQRSFLEPLQCGGIRTMGVHKPWSPSRSYGLVVRLNSALAPVTSLHSRADGSRHGVCSVVEHGGRLIVASRGGDCLLALDDLLPERH